MPDTFPQRTTKAICRASSPRLSKALWPRATIGRRQAWCPGKTDGTPAVQAGGGAGSHDERGGGEQQYRSGIAGTPAGRMRQGSQKAQWLLHF